MVVGGWVFKAIPSLFCLLLKSHFYLKELASLFGCIVVSKMWEAVSEAEAAEECLGFTRSPLW